MPQPQRPGFWVSLGVRCVRPLLMTFTRRNWRGAEHLPATGGCLIVVNHTSMLDPLAVAHFVYDNGRVPRFLAKASLFSVPLMGTVLRGARQIPVHRNTSTAAAAYTAAVDAINRGECVVVYPEGRINPDPDPWPTLGKTGAARIALATGAPVIPLAQWGTQDIWPPTKHLPRLLPVRTVSMLAGPPIELGDLAGMPPNAETLRAITARLLGEITELLVELRQESPPESLAA